MLIKLKQIQNAQYLRDTVDLIKEQRLKNKDLRQYCQYVTKPNDVIKLINKPESTKKVEMFINGVDYEYGKHFTVDFDNSILTWLNGVEFPLEMDDDIEIVYYTHEDNEFEKSKQISCGTYHNIILKMGTAWSWGNNDYGQLGLGNNITSTTPMRVDRLKNIKSIAGGCYHNLALLEDGTVWSWGYNSSGQLGLGHTSDVNIPTKIEITDVVQIACGDYFSMALKSDGTVWSWGSNNLGQLGLGHKTNCTIPTKVSGLGNIRMLYAGNYNCMALRRDGSVFAWGNNYYGQLGLGYEGDCLVPQKISLDNVAHIVLSVDNSYFITETGDVYSCGDNYYKQLGHSETKNKVSLPIRINEIGDIFNLCINTYFVTAIDRSGRVFKWGKDQTEIQNYISSPEYMDTLSNIVDVAMGVNFTIFLNNDKEIFVYGLNEDGQLGYGNTIPSPVPTKNTFIYDVDQISCGYGHVIVSLEDNRLFSWGNNDYGQLGNKSLELSLLPTQVRNITLN